MSTNKNARNLSRSARLILYCYSIVHGKLSEPLVLPQLINGGINKRLDAFFEHDFGVNLIVCLYQFATGTATRR